MRLTFFAVGVPRPQGSKRMVRTKGGRTLLLEDSKHSRPWRAEVAGEALGARLALGCAVEPGPVAVTLVFMMPRPKSHLRKGGGLAKGAPLRPTAKPDLDKLKRCVGDALVGTVIVDDSQIVQVVAAKFFTADTPGVLVRVDAMPFPASETLPYSMFTLLQEFNLSPSSLGHLERIPDAHHP